MGGSATIVAIDDSELELRLLRRMLQKVEGWDITLHEFTEGEAALEALRTRPADMIFMDYLMGGESAEDLVGQIKQACACPVVILSGMMDEKIQQNMIKRGASAFVAKGGGIDGLGQILDRYLTR